MEELYQILEDIDPNNDYHTATRLIDDGLLDSLSILTLVSELEDAFGIEITPTDMIPANFNSAQALWEMVERLQKDR